jgi:transcriptional regulator with XRE-family HTH domain
MILGELVKENRKKRDLSQKELAKLSGLSVGFISKVEKNYYKITSQESLTKIAKALKIDPRILFDSVLSKGHVVKEVPPRSLHDSLRELVLNLVEVPVVAELHMPGEIREYLYLPKPRSGKVNYVGVRAKGYCLEPDIKDGDTLIIDKDAQPEPGCTVLTWLICRILLFMAW